MKRFMTIVTVLALLSMAGSAFGQNQYGWTISNSAADPLANTGANTGILYIWYYCNTGDGMSAAEFDIAGTIPAFAVVALAPFLNAGSGLAALLAVGGCPDGPLPACQIFVGGGAPGNLCLVPSAANGVRGTVDCAVNPSLFPADYIGFATDGALRCADESAELCVPVSVEDESWGSIKGLYR